jgi:hypothetical protein
MLNIKFPTENKTVQEWRKLLEELVVAHEIAEDKSIKHPILEEDDQKVIGEKAIQEYLDDLKKSVHDWRAPGCGI